MLQSRLAVSAAVPGNRPRMTICMLTEFRDRADCARTSVAHCFGPLLFRLKYENAESKRQIMEPRAREQIDCLIFFLSFPPPLERRLLQKLETSPLYSPPGLTVKSVPMKLCCVPAAPCLILIHVGQKGTSLPTQRSPNTKQ